MDQYGRRKVAHNRVVNTRQLSWRGARAVEWGSKHGNDEDIKQRRS